MSTYRPRIIASVCLLLTACAVAFVMRSGPAHAAGSQQRQFIYGPVQVPTTQSLFFGYFNTGTLPTPPCTVVFRNLLTGAAQATNLLASTPPGTGTGVGFTGDDTVVVTIVTFNRPSAGQSIPKVFPCNVEVVHQASSEVTAILDPVR
jgi:hypothetical protein